MLLLRTIPLSLKILMRFVFVLPLWSIFYVFLLTLPILAGWFLLEAAPGLGIFFFLFGMIFVGVMTGIISMHPYLIGIRIGLKTLGLPIEEDQGSLLKSATWYAILSAIVSWALSLVSFGIGLLMTFLVIDTFFPSVTNSIQDPISTLSQQTARLARIELFSLPIALLAFAGVAFRAALLPVLAGAAAGQGPRGGRHGLLDGFGAHFASMLVILLFVTTSYGAVLALLGDLFRAIGLTGVLVQELTQLVKFVGGERQVVFTTGGSVNAIVAILISIWFFCLQCAAAALSYESRSRAPSRHGAELQPVSTVDIRALRQQRMGK